MAIKILIIVYQLLSFIDIIITYIIDVIKFNFYISTLYRLVTVLPSVTIENCYLISRQRAIRQN